MKHYSLLDDKEWEILNISPQKKSFPLEAHQNPSANKIVWMRVILVHALGFWKQKSTFFSRNWGLVSGLASRCFFALLTVGYLWLLVRKQSIPVKISRIGQVCSWLLSQQLNRTVETRLSLAIIRSNEFAFSCCSKPRFPKYIFPVLSLSLFTFSLRSHSITLSLSCQSVPIHCSN